uniref:Uncharacterized protein ycf33 n=1 Tax=Herposiphonia versicolor TaxID=2007163 RepID=A0A1Z1MFV0_9FLOR|nr:hypothetical protein [Herposiphonia versicolor]ARW64846.1 hypothetical protein [Herposiphonia versicolor]
MSNFWVNLYKFPRFLTSVFIGFFLTTFQPIFKLLKNKNNIVLFTIITISLISLFYKIIKIMTGLS